ncbi:unnamed protein product [Peronospora belbahrii]|uniref:Uncharacterized protein n=1 Tax=Peronospora belbahrii TaxID=622444 RepID=A0AAU9KRL0_9STRA|nr:unnamed protein product [Peronospora belbahrii]
MLDHLLPLLFRDFEHFNEANKENFGYIIRRRARSVSSRVSRTSRTPPRPPRRIYNSFKVGRDAASNCRLKRRRDDADDGTHEQRAVKKRHTQSKAKAEELITMRQEQKSTVKQDTIKEGDTFNFNGGIASNCKLKRRRDDSDDGNDEQRDVKKRSTQSKAKEEELIAKKQEQKPTLKQDTIKKENDEGKEEERTNFVTPKKKTQEPKISAKKAAKKLKKNKVTTSVTAHFKEKTMVKISKTTTPKRIPLQDVTHLYDYQLLLQFGSSSVTACITFVCIMYTPI